MPLTRLDPPIPLTTPLGDAVAHFVIDDGRDEPLRWVTFVNASGECWTFRNQEVRLWTNMTEGRDRVTPFSAETMARFAAVLAAMGAVAPVASEHPSDDDDAALAERLGSGMTEMVRRPTCRHEVWTEDGPTCVFGRPE